MQSEAVRWCLEIADRRASRPLEGAAPAAVFEAVEKDALRPLAAEPSTSRWMANRTSWDSFPKVRPRYPGVARSSARAVV
jgi:hypothetical protein